LRQDSWDTQRQVMRVSSRHWHELYKQPHLSFSEIELQIMATELFWILDMVRNWSWLVVWSIFYCPEIYIGNVIIPTVTHTPWFFS
jgi:hypothetical protein